MDAWSNSLAYSIIIYNTMHLIGKDSSISIISLVLDMKMMLCDWFAKIMSDKKS